MKPSVSIVMPIYNAMPYLTQALDSAINQTLSNIEIICVNDGSRDNSLEVMSEYAKKDHRIHVIDKPNGGYGQAMNTGIAAANGEYIGILEPDDYIMPDMYEVLYSRASKDNLDFVRSDFYSFITNSDEVDQLHLEKVSPWPEYYGPILNPQEDIRLFNLKMENWTGIYKADFVREHCIRFNESPGAGFQDNGFWFQTYCWATRIAIVDKPFYCYRNDNVNSSINQKNKVFVMLDEYAWIRKWLVNHPDLCEKFMGVYQYKKIHNCEFAFSRLAEEFQLPFLLRYSQEYRDAYAAGEIDTSLFYSDEWQRTKLIMDSPELFLQQYRDNARDEEKAKVREQARQSAANRGKLSLLMFYIKHDGLYKTFRRFVSRYLS